MTYAANKISFPAPRLVHTPQKCLSVGPVDFCNHGIPLGEIEKSISGYRYSLSLMRMSTKLIVKAYLDVNTLFFSIGRHCSKDDQVLFVIADG